MFFQNNFLISHLKIFVKIDHLKIISLVGMTMYINIHTNNHSRYGKITY